MSPEEASHSSEQDKQRADEVRAAVSEKVRAALALLGNNRNEDSLRQAQALLSEAESLAIAVPGIQLPDLTTLQSAVTQAATTQATQSAVIADQQVQEAEKKKEQEKELSGSSRGEIDKADHAIPYEEHLRYKEAGERAAMQREQQKAAAARSREKYEDRYNEQVLKVTNNEKMPIEERIAKLLELEEKDKQVTALREQRAENQAQEHDLLSQPGLEEEGGIFGSMFDEPEEVLKAEEQSDKTKTVLDKHKEPEITATARNLSKEDALAKTKADIAELLKKEPVQGKAGIDKKGNGHESFALSNGAEVSVQYQNGKVVDIACKGDANCTVSIPRRDDSGKIVRDAEGNKIEDHYQFKDGKLANVVKAEDLSTSPEVQATRSNVHGLTLEPGQKPTKCIDGVPKTFEGTALTQEGAKEYEKHCDKTAETCTTPPTPGNLSPSATISTKRQSPTAAMPSSAGPGK